LGGRFERVRGPSNVIRPRGLGGTPIKKNYPERKRLRFYPPEIFLFAALI
jgi:hypothetical protein